MKAVRSLFILFLFFTAAPVFAQFGKPVDMRDYQYKKEASGGLRLQSNGLTGFFEYGCIKDIFKTRFLQVEYTYYIDYRQKKQKALLPGGRDFFFGLQNRFHDVRINYGIKRSIADKAARNGVRLSFLAVGGFSLGLLKPYYLNIRREIDGGQTITPERYSEANAKQFLSLDSIVEAAPMRYGLNQIQPVPGVHGKIGLDFDWGTKDEFVKSLQAGVMLDIYYKRLPIMVNNSNRFYQVALYISFQFGKRW